MVITYISVEALTIALVSGTLLATASAQNSVGRGAADALVPDVIMREFGTIVGLLRCIVNSIRDQVCMRDTVAPKFVGHYLPQFYTMTLEQAP